MENTVIVGEAIAGHAEKVRQQIDQIIKESNTGTFDLAELLHEAKTGKYYSAWGFDSFGAYAKSLSLKVSKSYYLVRIVENMLMSGVTRAQYEPVGIAKLREISKLDPDATAPNGTAMTDQIKSLTFGAPELSLEEVQASVNSLKGLTGDDSIVWLNIAVKKDAREKVVKPALELCKKNIGTVGKDAEGMAKDASDGRALELICAAYLADPANGYEGE